MSGFASEQTFEMFTFYNLYSFHQSFADLTLDGGKFVFYTSPNKWLFKSASPQPADI